MTYTGANRRSRLLCRRGALLLSSAISLTAVTQAHAQATYEQNGPGDVTYSADSVNGLPEAVFLSSSDGNVSATIGAVTATSAMGDTGSVVSASASGGNAITVDIGSLIATGAGDVTGVATKADSGLTNISVGSLDLAGQRGISASSGGDVSITTGAVRVIGNGAEGNIDAIAAGREITPEGERIRVGGNVLIDAASIEVRGSEDAYAIHADVDGNASVKAGTIASDGEGVDLSVAGALDVALNGNVDAYGGAVNADGYEIAVTIANGVTVQAGGGAVEAEGAETVRIINNGTVINTGANGETAQGAILALADGDIEIVSNIAESNSSVLDFDPEAATVRAASLNGAVSITTGTTITNGSSMYGVFGYSQNGNVTIDAGSTVGTAIGISGAYAGEAVVGASRTGDIAITSDYAEANGYAASAIIGRSDSGNVTIVSNTAKSDTGGTIFGIGDVVSITTLGNTTSATDAAIVGRGNAVAVTTGEGTLTSSGGTGSVGAIYMNAVGDADLNNAGTVTSSGSVPTVQVVANGRATVLSNSIGNNGTGAALTVTGNLGASVSAATLTVANSTGVGVSVMSANGDAMLDLGSVTGSAAFQMVTAQTARGPVTIAAGTVRNSSTAANSSGIIATTGGGAAIVAGDVEAQGFAIRAVTATFNQQGQPIIPLNDGHVSITTTGTITSRGNSAISVTAPTHSFDITIEDTSVVTGNGGTVVAGGARVGDAVVVNRGLVLASGQAETGIGVSAFGAGDVDVTSNEIRVNSTAPISGQFSAGAISAVASGGSVTVDSRLATVSGPDRYGIYASTIADGSVSVTSGTLSKDATGRSGIRAASERGDIFVQSATLTNTGADSYGIEAFSSSGGDIAVINGTLVNSASGAGQTNRGHGIYALTDGQVSIESTSVSVAGDRAFGILALGTAGVDVKSGSVSSMAAAVVAESSAVTNVTIDGVVTSARASGLGASGNTLAINVAQGASVQGGTYGIIANNYGTGNATIVNAGTVAGGSNTAIYTYGQTTLINAGTLTAGANGIAAIMSETDDTVILQSGSRVTGVIDTGDGFDTVRLDGANGGTLAQFANAEQLKVDTGIWSTGTTRNTFDAVDIARGAELQVNLAADGSSGIETGRATVSGTLALNYTDTSEPGDITGVAIGGTGTVRLVGPGELVLGGNDFSLTGTTRIENGMLSLAGNLASDVVTTGSGTLRIVDGSNFTGNLLNDGTFLYDRTDSYTIAGDFSGSGALVKNGTGTLTFGGLYAFTGTTRVNGGQVSFTGQLAEDTVLDVEQGTVNLANAANGQQTIAELSGSSSGAIALGATQLTVNQTGDTTFAGAISGTGGLTKTGTGTLNMTGNSTYSGDTNVEGGVLKVNGALPNSTVIVADGGELGGNGTIGALAMNGGTLAPGNSIGRLTVNGPIVFTAASTYVVEANAAGQADRIDATGTATLGGAKVQVLAENGNYAGRTRYTILTAQGGLVGTFGSVTSNLAFLTPTLGYDATSVTLSLTRNDIDFADRADTRNARAVGRALTSLGAGNPLFEEALFLAADEVQGDFTSLAGEVYPGLAAGLLEDAQMLRRSMMGQPIREDRGTFGWATLLGSWGKADATAGTAKLNSNQKGVIGGVGFAADGFNASLGLGRIAADYTSAGHADVDSTVVAGTVRYAMGGIGATIGATYAWHDIDVSRATTLGGMGDSLRGKADGSTRQVFGEVGFGLETSGFTLTPFAGLAWVETRRDALTETGGDTALTLSSDKRHALYADLGVRVAGKTATDSARLSLAPYGSAAWRRAWGDRGAPVQASFGGVAGDFAVVGPVIARNAADLAAGLVASVGPMRLSAGYEGLVSNNWTNHSAQLRFSIAF